MVDLGRNSFSCRNPEILGLVFGMIFSRSSHSKKVRHAVRPLQRALPSLPCAVAQMGNDINDLYYQFHIMLYKCQQLGKKNMGVWPD